LSIAKTDALRRPTAITSQLILAQRQFTKETTMDNTLNNPSANPSPDPLFTPYVPRTQPRLRPKAPRVSVRNVGFSASDEARLKELQQLLSGGIDDSPSVSLIVRTSIGEYLTKLLGMKQSNPASIADERAKLASSAKRICRGKRRRQAHRQS
jgi:hypothetical protein